MNNNNTNTQTTNTGTTGSTTPNQANQGGATQINQGTTSAATTVTNNPVNPVGQIDAPNRDFFIQTLEANLSSDVVKKIVGDLDKKKQWKNDRVEEVLKTEDKDKIEAYDRLKVKDLPFDWELRLERLKHLEVKLSSFNELKKDLAEWVDTFQNKKSNEVQGEINTLTTNLTNTEQELNSWKDTFTNSTPQEIKENKAELTNKLELAENELKEWHQDFSNLNSQAVKEKIADLEEKLSEWTEAWKDQELDKVKAEWEDLKQRPDVPITEKEYWDDYAKRQSISKSKNLEGELTEKKTKVEELEKEIKKLQKTIDNFLEDELKDRYLSMESVITPDDAKKEIAKLLAEVEIKWGEYLNSKRTSIVAKRSVLSLSVRDDNQVKEAQQILDWVKDAQKTEDYQTLFEKWSGGKEYSKKYDFDGGSLYLLGKNLEIINTPQTNLNNQTQQP